MPTTSTRNNMIDAIRGTAIFIMIAANSAPYILGMCKIPLWIRFIFSLAAPGFIFLSGYSFQLQIEQGKGRKGIVKRAMQVLLVGVIIDIFIWNVLPFDLFDVLYLIAFSLLFLAAVNNLNGLSKLIIALLIIITGIGLHYIFEYRFDVNDISLGWQISAFGKFNVHSSLKRLLFDGWFPVFPWMSLPFLGALARKYERKFSRYAIGFGLMGIVLLSASFATLALNEHLTNELREGYLELFYPVKGWFWMTLTGCMLLIISLASYKGELTFSPISQVGKTSLFFYFFHTLIISLILVPVFEKYEIASALLGILTLIIFWITILIIAVGLKKILPSLRKNKIIRRTLFFVGL